MWKKFQNSPPCNWKILAFEMAEFFFWLCEKWGSCTSQSHINWNEKKFENGGAFLDSFFNSSFLHAWKFSLDLDLCNI